MWLYLAALLSMSTAWVQDWAQSGVPKMCATHVSTRVQGLACGVGMVVMVTNGNSLALGLALATLKSVADTGACSVMLASMTVLFAVRKGNGVGKLVAMASFALLSLVTGCWHEEHGQRYTEGAVIALVVMALFVCVRASLGVLRVALRYSVLWGARVFSTPVRVVRWTRKKKT